MQNDKIGTLYVVATPIGNLQDITERSIMTLRQVDRIVAEDTRHSAVLLKHFSVHKPILSMHEFNERERLAIIIDYLTKGENIALISDAGTPLISDPGFNLVREAKALGIKVVPIPGACAVIAALSVAGLPTDKFVFEGFLPAKPLGCYQRLSLLRHESRTLVFYEAPHRLLSTLKNMIQVFGPNRRAVIARELTKKYESVMSDPLSVLFEQVSIQPETQRGEIVILLAGVKDDIRETKEVVPEKVLDILLEELPLKQAVTLASKITGERKNVLYDRALLNKFAK
jgi:16S rRNA (cytidine1402-2'-O)-methyltransferase